MFLIQQILSHLHRLQSVHIGKFLCDLIQLILLNSFFKLQVEFAYLLNLDLEMNY